MFAPDPIARLRVPITPMTGFSLQPKLTIGAPNDRYEQEADRVADEVMRKPLDEPITATGVGLQRKCAGCDAEDELRRTPADEQEDEISAKAAPGQVPAITPAVTHQVRALGRGAPLPPADQRFFASRLGHDFSRVRVHADSRGAQAASAVRARAFTLGPDVAFARGEYAGGTEGRRLLAHELTHVIQQGEAPPLPSEETRLPGTTGSR